MIEYKQLLVALGFNEPRSFFNLIHDSQLLVGQKLHNEIVITNPDLMRWCKCTVVKYD